MQEPWEKRKGRKEEGFNEKQDPKSYPYPSTTEILDMSEGTTQAWVAHARQCEVLSLGLGLGFFLFCKGTGWRGVFVCGGVGSLG